MENAVLIRNDVIVGGASSTASNVNYINEDESVTSVQETIRDIKQNIVDLNNGKASIYVTTVNGTTDASGITSVTLNNKFKNTPFCLSNVSRVMGTPYSVTIDSYSNAYVGLRIRRMGDNSAVANTAVNFPIAIIGIE